MLRCWGGKLKNRRKAEVGEIDSLAHGGVVRTSYLPRFAAISAAGDLPGHNRLPVWLGENENSNLFIALGNLPST